jgi:hypothetical protein
MNKKLHNISMSGQGFMDNGILVYNYFLFSYKDLNPTISVKIYKLNMFKSVNVVYNKLSYLHKILVQGEFR